MNNWIEKRLPVATLRALNAIRAKDPTVVFDPHSFPWISPFERQWKTIRTEWDELRKSLDRIPAFHEISSHQRYISSGDQWKTFVFYAYGHRIDKNCETCPQTDQLLQQIPGMTTAMFSYLKPGATIPEHVGPYNGYLRHQLALKVPRQKDQCWIRVAGQKLHWQEGRSLVFDDTFPHEVRNDTAEERVILFVDFLRPLPFPLSLRNRWVHFLMSRSDLVKEAVENSIQL